MKWREKIIRIRVIAKNATTRGKERVVSNTQKKTLYFIDILFVLSTHYSVQNLASLVFNHLNSISL